MGANTGRPDHGCADQAVTHAAKKLSVLGSYERAIMTAKMLVHLGVSGSADLNHMPRRARHGVTPLFEDLASAAFFDAFETFMAGPFLRPSVCFFIGFGFTIREMRVIGIGFCALLLAGCGGSGGGGAAGGDVQTPASPQSVVGTWTGRTTESAGPSAVTVVVFKSDGTVTATQKWEPTSPALQLAGTISPAGVLTLGEIWPEKPAAEYVMQLTLSQGFLSGTGPDPIIDFGNHTATITLQRTN